MRPDGLKWFCAVSAATLDLYDSYDFRDVIRVAVGSALRNTGLRPTLVYDGPRDAFTDEIADRGAVVIHHRTPLYDAFAAHASGDAVALAVMAGAFLRFEIPLLETAEPFALYTDCDVLFLRDPQFPGPLPGVFGATSQSSTDPAQDMNSGVMLMNLANMRMLLPALNDFTRRSLDLGFDQEILRAFFGSHYQVLDRSLNWKPYWGWNPNAQIVHFHGPKPEAARAYLAHGTMPSNPTWANLLERNPAGYEAYTRLWLLAQAALRDPGP